MIKFFQFLLIFSFVALSVSCGNKRKARKQTTNKPQSETSFVWVSNGVVQAPIIVRADVSPRTMFAVEELAAYVEKITGVKPPILKGAPKTTPNKAVWIGLHDEFKSLFPELNLTLKIEETVIVSNVQHLAIFGSDELPQGFQNVIFHNRSIPNAQRSYGTINAIYSFLQDYLEVRWFWPGELGEDYPSKKTLNFKTAEVRYTPQMTWRSGIIMTSRPGWNKNDFATDLWTQRQRMFFSADFINAGHPFNDWWIKYAETNLDVFALNERGHRNPILEPRTVKLCVSNEKVISLWLNEVQEIISQNPFMSIFSVNENDSYNQGHCTCENCIKWDQVRVSEKVKNLSDRHILFANKMVEALRKQYPKRNDLKVLYFAYGNNRPLPIKERLDKNVGVVSVANFHLRRKSTLDESESSVKEYLDWSKMSDLVYWRPNIGNPVGFRWGLPDVAFNQIFDDFKFVADNNCRGVFFDSYPNHWSTQGIQYYMAGQLSWNPRLDKKVILDDYFARLYGPASVEMSTIWEMCEITRSSLFETHGDAAARFFIHEAYNKAWFQKVKQLLHAAKLKVKGASIKYLQRIEFAEYGLVFTEKMVEIRSLMVEFEKTAKQNENVNRAWEDMSIYAQSAPKYAINFNDLGVTRNLNNLRRKNKLLNGLITDSPYVPPRVKKNNRQDKDDDGME